MKKRLVSLVLISLLISSMFAMGKKDNSNSLEKIKAKGVFVLGLDDSFPPLGYRNKQNEIVGYDIDIATEVCKRLDVTLKCQPIDWNAKEQELNTGTIDCIWNGFTITDERLNAMSFSTPYLDNQQVVIVNADSNYKTLADLKGKVVGLQGGSSAADALNDAVEFKNSLKEVVEFKENLTALMDLETKGVDAVIMDAVVGNYNIKTSGKPFVVLNEALASEKYGIGFRKTDVELRDAVQSILEEMVKDGTMESIDQKWFGTSMSVIGK